MPDMIHADTTSLRRFADRLDPAPAVTARAAAAELRAGVPDCTDPLPGCVLFNQTVVRVADRFEAFCTEIEQGIQGYASAVRDSAAIYTTADSF